MTQQQWSNQPAWGQQPPPGQAGFNRPAYGQSGFGSAPFGGQPSGFGGGQPGIPSYGGPMAPPPPRRRNPLRLVLLGLIGLVLVAVVGLVLTNFIGGSAQVAYQNDDYKVPPADTSPPPIPLPKTYSEAETFVAKNPFYNQTAPIPVRCDSQPINVSTSSDAQLESHFNGLMECLVRVWQPPVEKAGYQIVRPSVTIYSKEITTKCGKSGVNAFYCSGDQQVYFSNQLYRAVGIVAKDKWAADVVMAHEFGHALQGRTGILVSAHALGQNSGDEQTELLYSRRLETQADCFSGMFIRAVSVSLGVQQSDLAGIQQTYVAVGDDTLTGDPNVNGNHGLAKSREYWGTTGLGTSTVGKCNTFTAAKNLVR